LFVCCFVCCRGCCCCRGCRCCCCWCRCCCRGCCLFALFVCLFICLFVCLFVRCLLLFFCVFCVFSLLLIYHWCCAFVKNIYSKTGGQGGGRNHNKCTQCKQASWCANKWASECASERAIQQMIVWDERTNETLCWSSCH